MCTNRASHLSAESISKWLKVNGENHEAGTAPSARSQSAVSVNSASIYHGPMPPRGRVAAGNARRNCIRRRYDAGVREPPRARARGEALPRCADERLLAGNSGGEGLADCILRHTVWAAEKPGYIPLKIARKCRNSAIPALKPDRRKCPADSARPVLWPFFLEGARAVRFQPPIGECNAITNR
jgi:hypothetical protein